MLDICRAGKISVGLAGLLTAASCFSAADPWQMNMHRGVTPLSHEMYNLHMVSMAICVIIGIIVFGVMVYSILHHRKSKGYEAAGFHDNPRLEIIWTIIPFFILVALAIPATKVLMRMENLEKSAVTIKIIGHQWKWQYQYLDEGINFYSHLATPYNQIINKEKKNQWYLLEVDKPLMLPVNKKVRFLVTSEDVIHSWWVPEIGVKRDAIPGFMHEAWAFITEPGTYRGQCAELCGINHGFMPIVVRAVSLEEYRNWVAKQPKVEDKYAENQAEKAAPKTMTREELMSLGKERFNSICSACHKADGQGMPPMFPALRGSSIAVGKPIERHIGVVLNGVPGTAMQPFKGQLNDEEVAAIITYERNAWGNNTGDLVQPAEVLKVKNGETVQPKIVNKAQAGGLQ